MREDETRGDVRRRPMYDDDKERKGKQGFAGDTANFESMGNQTRSLHPQPPLAGRGGDDDKNLTR